MICIVPAWFNKQIGKPQITGIEIYKKFLFEIYVIWGEQNVLFVPFSPFHKIFP